jgi:uncharacterized damage-inducible protein DinB
MSTNPTESATPFMMPEQLLHHWQGHRRLTRRVIAAFPEDQLFTHSVGAMRTFGEMAMELLGMGAPMARGIATGVWQSYTKAEAVTRADLLRLWDESTSQIDDVWSRIPPERFQERMTAFGVYEGPVYELMMYVVDNEIHHRGQGYAYLRALGVEPPPFWERD